MLGVAEHAIVHRKWFDISELLEASIEAGRL